MGFWTAHYDPKTDKIVGCEDNTMMWYHELRHKQQLNNKIIYWTDFYITQASFIFGNLFLGLTLFNPDYMYLVGISYIPILLFNGLLEADAIGYQLRMWWINRR